MKEEAPLPSRTQGKPDTKASADEPETKVVVDTSRGAEGPGLMTLRQPTERHGGNAGIDKEVTMTGEGETDRPVVFGVQANTTDEELEELAEVVVAALDQQAADHHRQATTVVHPKAE